MHENALHNIPSMSEMQTTVAYIDTGKQLIAYCADIVFCSPQPPEHHEHRLAIQLANINIEDRDWCQILKMPKPWKNTYSFSEHEPRAQQ
jgi:hypothetical protein